MPDLIKERKNNKRNDETNTFSLQFNTSHNQVALLHYILLRNPSNFYIHLLTKTQVEVTPWLKWKNKWRKKSNNASSIHRLRNLSRKLWLDEFSLSLCIFFTVFQRFSWTTHVSMRSSSTQLKLQLLAHFRIPLIQISNQIH